MESSQRLGRHRWIIESCLPWLTRYRRYDRLAAHFEAFANIGCLLICYQRLTKLTK